MQLKITLNKYGYREIKCPFCDQRSFVKPPNSGPNKMDELHGIKRHLINRAESEALDYFLNPKDVAMGKHLKYVSEHTKELIKQPSTFYKRVFDDDLTI